MRWYESASNPVFVIAEIGGNHEGDFDYAMRLTELAVSSGADAVKFQIYTGDSLVSSVESPDRNAHFKRFELQRDQYRQLAEVCRRGGAQFMASIWSLELIDVFDPMVNIHKVGSGDLTSYPILRRLAATGKPIILSTGLSDLADIAGAVEQIAQVDPGYVTDGRLALLQCTSSYPCPDGDVNLLAMNTLKETFHLPVGYSDHTVGTAAALAAATMGADILEIHFTDQPQGREFRDHQVSFTVDQIHTLCDRIRQVRTLQGSAGKDATPSERSAQHTVSFRRSVYAARRIEAGEVLDESNTTVLRPATGIPASRYYQVLGRRAARELLPGEVLRDEDLAPGA